MRERERTEQRKSAMMDERRKKRSKRAEWLKWPRGISPTWGLRKTITELQSERIESFKGAFWKPIIV